MIAADNDYLRVDARFTTALVLGFGLAALFLLAQRYVGICEDGVFYTVQALRRTYPVALNGDLFFRYGSQDSFTLFSGIYAALIGRFGVESSAYALSRLFGVVLAGSALLMAREIMHRRLAWLALALFLAIPGSYGPHQIFAYDETTVTPRALAEALTLLATWFALRDRWLAALLALAAGMAMHPLQAVAGVPLLAALRDPKRAPVLLGAAAVLGLAVAATLAAWAPFGPLRMLDAEWRASIDPLTPFLEASNWWIVDWQRAAVPLATLGVGLIALDSGPARRLAACALGVGVAGLVLFLVGSFLAPIVLLFQGQPWRWMWLAKTVAVLTLVPTGASLWRRGANGRAILALLAVAWYGAEDALGLEAALCALAAALFEFRAGRRLPLLWAPVAVLALALAAGVFNLIGAAPRPLAAGAAIAAWWVVFRSGSAWLAAVAALLVAAVFGRQLVANIGGLRAADYDAFGRALAPWQSHIGQDATVFFPPDPSVSWLALHRRTYLGYVGVVFSRQAALERNARLKAVQRAAGPYADWFLERRENQPAPPLATVRRVCALPDLDFMVLPVDYPVPRLVAEAVPPYDLLYLYDCRVLRTEAGHE